MLKEFGNKEEKDRKSRQLNRGYQMIKIFKKRKKEKNDLSPLFVLPPECSPHASDEILVWGEHSKKKLKALYEPSEERYNKYISIGNSQYDEVITYLTRKRNNKFYKDLYLDPNKKTVLFLSSTHAVDIYGEACFDTYIKPISALDMLYDKLGTEINIIVKLHPSESMDHYKKYMTNVDRVVFLKDEIMLHEILLHTDIAITVSSTALVEAMIFSIPTIQLLMDGLVIRGEKYYRYGCAILIKDTDGLIQIIGNIIHGRCNPSNARLEVEVRFNDLKKENDKK